MYGRTLTTAYLSNSHLHRTLEAIFAVPGKCVTLKIDNLIVRSHTDKEIIK